MKRVSCRDIAKKLGISHAAVSMALRDLPSVSRATKKKVRETAEQMGYRPDPMLGALNAYRQASQPARYHATLAWVYTYPKPDGQNRLRWFSGAARYAATLGFRLEEFWVPGYDDWMRLARVFRSRNIQGLIRIPPVMWNSPDASGDSYHGWNFRDPATWPWRDFPWGEFSAISMGWNIGPDHHQVVHDQTHGVGLAVSELAALGHRKIGIVLHAINERIADYYWLAGYLVKCAELGLAPLYLSDKRSYADPCYVEDVAQWLLHHRPDAVIAPGDGDILPALRLAKLRIPEDIAVAFLCVMENHPEMAAIDHHYDLMGMVVVNQLSDLIRHNERGIPASTLRYLVEGSWRPGGSAPPVSVSA